MNRLPFEARVRVLTLLVEGMSLRAAGRATDTAFNTVAKLFVDAGRACAAYQDGALRNLKCRRIQLDEIWSFIYAKEKNVRRAKSAPSEAGDVWTWVAIDADTKLVPSWRVGDRSSQTAIAFTDDLASRLSNRVQITTDGHRAYLEAIEGSFGADVDYAMLVKIYGASPDSAKGRSVHWRWRKLRRRRFRPCIRKHSSLAPIRCLPAAIRGWISRLISVALVSNSNTCVGALTGLRRRRA